MTFLYGIGGRRGVVESIALAIVSMAFIAFEANNNFFHVCHWRAHFYGNILHGVGGFPDVYVHATELEANTRAADSMKYISISSELIYLLGCT